MDLICKFITIDGGAAAAGAGGVACLDHEVGDDAVDDGVVVIVALGEGGEVGACLTNDVRERAAGILGALKGSREMATLGAWLL